MRHHHWFFLWLLILGVACGGESVPLATETPSPTDTSPSPVPFDREAMLTQLTYEIILPTHEQFLQETAALQTAVHTYRDDLTEANLAAVQAAWRETAAAWKPARFFELGPIQDSYIHNRIYAIPVRAAFIDDTIANPDQVIDEAFIDSVGSTSVGLAAIEYLIFNSEGEDTPTSQRLAYLVALADNLHTQAERLHQAWLDYADAFIQADLDAGELQGSINMLLNELVAELERIVQVQVGKPLGKRTGGEPRPDFVESPYGQHSLALVISTVKGFRAAFTGGDGVGLDDYLDYLDAAYEDVPLSTAVNQQTDNLLTALAGIDAPLQTAVTTQPEQVEAAYEAARMLVVLVKVDVVNHLSVTITFNDSDGD